MDGGWMWWITVLALIPLCGDIFQTLLLHLLLSGSSSSVDFSFLFLALRQGFGCRLVLLSPHSLGLVWSCLVV